jgi:hypothetical protein
VPSATRSIICSQRAVTIATSRGADAPVSPADYSAATPSTAVEVFCCHRPIATLNAQISGMSAPLQSQTATAAMSHHSTIDLSHCLTIAGHMPQVRCQDEREFSPGFFSFPRGESPPRGEPLIPARFPRR